MLRNVSLLVVAAGLPALAFPQGTDTHYRCTNGDLVRRVQIFHETGAAVPCEVHYFKDSEVPGQREVLWRALNESGYCEARTREFLDRLESFGWQCEAAPAPVAATGGAAGEGQDAARPGAPELPAPSPEAPDAASAELEGADDTDVLDAGRPPAE